MKLIKILLLLLVTSALFGSFDDYEPSARARALGGAFYSTSDDANGIFYNPAGLSLAGNSLAIGNAKIMGNDFHVVSTVAFSMELPKKFGVLGIGLHAMDAEYMDVTLTSEKIYALSHSFTLLKDVHSEVYFGYTANMYHLSFSTFGNQPAFGINVGALAILHQRTQIGFSVTNVNNPKVGVDNSLDLPQKLAVGISYAPYQNLTTSIELKKGFASITEIHTGIEMDVLSVMTLRFGVRNNPTKFSTGAGFNIYDIVLDYGYDTHTSGDTHHFSLGYKF
jgi:hypothetical protein